MARPTPPRTPSARAASAGAQLIGTTLLCALIAAGIGALLGATLAGAVVGLLLGLPAGIFVVRARFRDL